MSTPTDTPTPLTDKGTLQSEFRDADAAYQFAKKLDDADAKSLAPKRQRIMALKNGYAPWPAGQKKGGQTNLNWGEMEQALDTRRIPYVRRLTEQQVLFDIDLGHKFDPDIQDDFVRYMSNAASGSLRKWRGHYQQFLRIVTDMIDYGLGVAMWDDDVDPRFKRVPRYDAFFDADAEPTIEDQQAVVIRARWSPKQLLRYLDHPDAESRGYKKQNLRDALKHLAFEQGREVNSVTQKVEETEEQIRRNQYGEQALAPLIVYQVFFKDLETGKVNLYVVAQITTHQEGSTERKTSSVYLRQKKGAYDEMGNAIALFPTPSADTIQGLRGHGHRVYPKAIASSRAKSMALDNHAFETTRLFAGGSGSDAMRMQIRKSGPFAVVPPELAPVDLPPRDVLGLDGFAIGMLQDEIRKGLSGNPLTRNPQTSSSPEKHRSKFQEQADLLDDAGLSEVEIGTFDFYLDALLSEFYRRLTLKVNKDVPRPGDDLRKHFQKQLKDLELPPTVWRNLDPSAITALRSVGSGSVMDQLVRAQALISIAGSLGERGAHETLEFYLGVLVGPRNVRRFLKDFERLGGKTEQHWVASVETNMALMGQGLLRPTGDQKDDSHLRQHVEGVMPTLQAAMEGTMQLEELAQFVTGLDILIPHMDGHLARLEQDETKAVQFDEHRRAVEELRRNYNELRALAEQAMEAEANAAQEQAEAEAQAQQAPEVDVVAQQKLMHAQADHDQKLQQRDENFQRAQQERQQAHVNAESRKEETHVRGEHRKDGSAVRQEVRKDHAATKQQPNQTTQ